MLPNLQPLPPAPDQLPTEPPQSGKLTTVAPPVTWWWLVLVGAAALILGLGFLESLRLLARPLAFLLLGVAIATSLAPLVGRLTRWLPRPLAVALVYLLLLLVIISVGWEMLPSLLGGIQEFGTNLPSQVDQVQQFLSRNPEIGNSQWIRSLTAPLAGLAQQLLLLPLSLYTVVIDTLLVLFISIYALIVAPSLQEFLLSLLSARQRPHFATVLNGMSRAMGGYVRGVFIGGVIIGLITYLGLLLIGVNYAAVLGLLAGILEIIPILGPIFAGAVIVVVAFFQSPTIALIALIFMIVLQQVESNLVFPAVMSKQTEMSPLLSIVAFFAGNAVGGLLGALVAIPLAAALRVFVVEMVAPAIRRWSGAEPT